MCSFGENKKIKPKKKKKTPRKKDIRFEMTLSLTIPPAPYMANLGYIPKNCKSKLQMVIKCPSLLVLLMTLLAYFIV